MANVPITSLPEATAPSASDYLILQGTSTQRIKWSALLDKLYPVGCIYQSADATSPASFLGGTWERIKDRFLLAAGDTYAAGTTGGEATHVLTVSEMPSHGKHLANKNGIPIGVGNYVGYLDVQKMTRYGKDGRGWNVNSENEIYPAGNSTGGSLPHNNMPPYIAVYVWRRIA